MRFIALAGVIALAAFSSAQSSPQAGVFGVPTNFSASYLLQRKSSLAVIEVPIKAWASKNPNFSYQLEGLGGYNATSTQAAFGTALAAHWKVNSLFSLTIGLGATVPAASFTWSQINSNTIGLLIGGSVKF